MRARIGWPRLFKYATIPAIIVFSAPKTVTRICDDRDGEGEYVHPVLGISAVEGAAVEGAARDCWCTWKSGGGDAGESAELEVDV
jgi:hypothetical protein